MKVLTVLVPTYNVEKYLRRCLDSLLLPEVLEEIEVLVVNDGSKDGSADIARAYEKKYPQTVVFVDKEMADMVLRSMSESRKHRELISKCWTVMTGSISEILLNL